MFLEIRSSTNSTNAYMKGTFWAFSQVLLENEQIWPPLDLKPESLRPQSLRFCVALLSKLKPECSEGGPQLASLMIILKQQQLATWQTKEQWLQICSNY